MISAKRDSVNMFYAQAVLGFENIEKSRISLTRRLVSFDLLPRIYNLV